MGSLISMEKINIKVVPSDPMLESLESLSKKENDRSDLTEEELESQSVAKIIIPYDKN